MPITTTLVRAGLQGLRLPLTAVEWVTHSSEPLTWPPAVAYETLEAEAKKMLGSLLHDDDLVREGVLQRAKIKQLLAADRLTLQAEQTRQAADAQLEERLAAAEKSRSDIESTVERREQQLAAEKAEKARQIADETRRREEAAAVAAAARDKVVAAEERRAQRTRITEESAALAKRRRALGATKKAQVLENELEAKRRQRKSS